LKKQKLIRTKGGLCLSYYNDALADANDATEALKRLIAIYHKEIITPAWAKEFCNSLIELRFTKKQLKDAIDNLIRTNPYNSIKIADVFSHKKQLKLYTYNDKWDFVTTGKYLDSDFSYCKVNGKDFCYLTHEWETLKK